MIVRMINRCSTHDCAFDFVPGVSLSETKWSACGGRGQGGNGVYPVVLLNGAQADDSFDLSIPSSVESIL